MTNPLPDVDLAFRLADLADEVTLRWWSPEGVEATTKADGSPVTPADVAAEEAMLEAVLDAVPGDGFLGEEVGETPGTTGRRWIVDGIDGTRYFAAGARTWGTLIALEQGAEIVLGVASSPAQDRRWWAVRGGGAFTGSSRKRSGAVPMHVSKRRDLEGDRAAVLPAHADLAAHQQQAIDAVVAGGPPDQPWSHQLRVAEGLLDICIWYCGDVWDHAAPSLIVEEAGGRFSDHRGGRRLDTRTAVYSNGERHDDVLAALDRPTS